MTIFGLYCKHKVTGYFTGYENDISKTKGAGV